MIDSESSAIANIELPSGAMAHPTSRRWLLTKCETITSLAKLMSSYVSEGMTRIAETAATMEEAAGKARQQLALRPEREIIFLKKA
jgi:hypothetical protein